MSLARYGFLPWLRRGISKDINQQDNLGSSGGDAGRPTVDLSLTLTGMAMESNGYTNIDAADHPEIEPEQNGKLVSKSVQLIGPGDITGVKADAIVKTEPRPDVGNFEPNYFPYIEFYEEDFPWRYTPASEQNGKLRPWLVLVVLEEREYERRFLPGASLSAITVTGPKEQLFPPAEETWAWAHVHANRPLDPNNSTQNLQSIVEDNPNLASSRLICPRRLKSNTRYTAFLLPAFEQGRLSGLGADADRILNEGVQAHAWGDHQADEYANLWPVYFDWNFQTSDLTDFEYLVRRIEARLMKDPVGRRPMDMQDAGYELSYLGQESGILRVEGALQIINADKDRLDFLNQSDAQSFIDSLQTILNLNDPLESGDGTTPTFDRTLYANGEDDDPIITPPLYGQWQADKTKVGDGSSKPWFRELNLDPRNRVAAGFGTLVVRKNQDEYMDRAWEQAADIIEAQQQIRLARFSAQTAQKLQQNDFNGMDDAVYSAFSSALHSRSPYQSEEATVQRVVRQRVIQTQNLSTLLQSTRQQMGEKQIALENAENELATINNNITNKENEITGKKAEIQTLTGEIEQLDQDIQNLQNLIGQKNDQIANKEQAIEDVQQELIAIDNQIENETATSVIADLQAQKEAKAIEKSNLEDDLDDLQEELQGLEDQKQEKENSRNTKEQEKSTAEDQLDTLENELEGLKDQKEGKEQQIAALENEIDNLRQEINRLSRLHLPTSAVRQDYRKVARVNGPLLRRALGTQERLDPVTEISQQVDTVTLDSSSSVAEMYQDWDDLEWGADAFQKTSIAVFLAANLSATSTHQIQQQVKDFVAANPSLNQRLRQRLAVKTDKPIPSETERTRPLLAYPEFRESTYEALANISAELMLPNVQLIPMDTFSLLEVNQRFIESYLVGLNHEMARELLWREFPTDQRGSYFRAFWDDTDNLETTFPPPDIELLTLMDRPLGQNLPDDRPVPPPSPDNPHVVFVIRSELLKKFPNALVYMQKADAVEAPRKLTTGTVPEQRLMPIFQANIDPEISFFGFPITADEAVGSATETGWFFVIQERPGEARFGLDISKENPGSEFGDITEWNDLAWPHLDTEEGIFLRVQSFAERTLPAESGSTAEVEKYTWGYNSAHMAGILLQLPFRAAVHATDMVKLPETDG